MRKDSTEKFDLAEYFSHDLRERELDQEELLL